MITVKHPVSGVVCTVTPEKAERLGWPLADVPELDIEPNLDANTDNQDDPEEDEVEPEPDTEPVKPTPRTRRGK